MNNDIYRLPSQGSLLGHSLAFTSVNQTPDSFFTHCGSSLNALQQEPIDVEPLELESLELAHAQTDLFAPEQTSTLHIESQKKRAPREPQDLQEVQELKNLKEKQESLITEIIIPLSSGRQNDVVLPMLAHLSQQVENRWFTWITCTNLTTKELCQYNFAQEKVRIIRAKNEEDGQKLIWDALHNGTSATVVSDIGTISESTRSYLNEAASLGNSRAILLSEQAQQKDIPH